MVLGEKSDPCASNETRLSHLVKGGARVKNEHAQTHTKSIEEVETVATSIEREVIGRDGIPCGG